jgi:hypothetical protein
VSEKALQPLALVDKVFKSTPESLLLTVFLVSSDNPTAEDALVRAMCNASPSAMVGSGQPPSQ